MTLLEKYRSRFPAIVSSLELAKSKNRLSHAYLVYSDNQESREIFCQALTQLSICPTPTPQGSACGVCNTCRLVAENKYPETYTLMPTSKSRIIPVGDSEHDPDTVRWFESRFYLCTTTEAGKKMGIIYDVDRMQPRGQNAFLKTLEEPPANTMFILATGNPSSLLPTIRSRCQTLMLLENYCSYNFPGKEELYKTLYSLHFESSNNIAVSEKCTQTILAMSKSLQAIAKKSVSEQWQERLEGTSQLEGPAKKQIEKRYVAAIQAEYLNLRKYFLSAIHSWISQLYLISCGASIDDLANREMMDDLDFSIQVDEEQAFHSLNKAEGLIENLKWSVNEELAFREFCMGISFNT